MELKFSRFARTLALSLMLASCLAFSSAPALAQPSTPVASATVGQNMRAGASEKAPSSATDNPYGIMSLWQASDAVAKTVLLLLAIMSAGSWYILVVKFLEQAKMMRHARTAASDFWTAKTVAEGKTALPADSAYQFIVEAGLMATDKHAGLMGKIPLNDWITMSISRSIDRVNSNMQNGLAFLATVGSIAPFVGLFGTVWGIYHALSAIGASGQASIDKVAGPVGEALLMTAIGLAVAVPAVLAYNWLVRRNKAVMDDVRGFGNDLHAVLLSSSHGQ